MIKVSEFSTFTVVRVVSLSIRPLFILTLLYLNEKELSAQYALAITLLQGSLIFFNNEAYRSFYQIRFNHSSDSAVKTAFVKYVFNVKTQLILMTIPVYVFCFVMTDKPILSLMMLLACLAEKVYDEMQRFCIYSKEYLRWAKMCFLKFVVPVLLTALASLFVSANAIFVFVLAHSVVIVFIFFKNAGIKKLNVKFIASRRFKYYWHFFVKRNYMLILYSLSISNVLLMDRLLVGYFFVESIDTYVLICNVGVVFVLIHDYLYMTKLRPQLIKPVNAPLHYSLNVRNVLLAAGPLLCVSCGFLGINQLNLLEVNVAVIMLVLSGYALYNFVNPVVTYSYWNRGENKNLYTEFSAFAIYAVSLFYLVDKGLLGVALSFVIYMTIRLALYLSYFVSKEAS